MPEIFKPHPTETPRPIPSLPARAFTMSAARRNELATAFRAGGKHYDAVRPSYPAAALDFMVPPRARDAVDVGAGTGIFTAMLLGRGLRVRAVEPSTDMLTVLRTRLPEVIAAEGTGEHTGLEADSADVITYAQAWHWVDPKQASIEAARILRSGGLLSLVWNQLDVSVSWVHRLARIMHAGDVHRPDFQPPLGQEFFAPEPGQWTWNQELTGEQIIELAKSRSYYLRASAATRSRVESNLSWYLYDHLGHEEDTPITVPYLTHAWRARLR
ncbi:class I SAM-dependent methyltransferase [Paeniglutamicibacter kerguelensis]|uniref:SAM-dependent methyltransferase n=1 Tax=Paeniglutamicibacter kerguelensis TaxID=254788 RepID=A0ABS4X9K5_9MICC|nr:class I SAM-dependent methyltransferase [Paeniglutamicibacter kerguelensis]MBP2385154.1 SAM-dependent methyltransferase [Paeniglutamicibacter kerguelensis]